MNKRGQFYLLAALIIIGVIAGLTTVYNQVSVLKEDFTVYDLSSELNFEGAQVLASGVFNDRTDTEILDNLEFLMNHYSLKNPSNELIGLYGNEETLYVIVYRNMPTGSIRIDLGTGSPQIINPTGGTHGVIETFDRPDEEIIILQIEDEDFVFNLRPGQTLFMIVEKERGEERFVSGPEGGAGGPIQTEGNNNLQNDEEDNETNIGDDGNEQ